MSQKEILGQSSWMDSKNPKGIEYFKLRGVAVEDEENINACKKIIRITKGHPWWIGLIAGQIITEKSSPKEYLEENSDGILANGTQVQQYFSSIWEKLGENAKGKNAQEIVRYLAESARPLSLDQLNRLLDISYNQIQKAVKLLDLLGLLITHDNKSESSKKYQIHPLVREFVHDRHSKEEQLSYVHKLLGLIIGKRVYALIFQNKEQQSGERINKIEAQDFVDAIETCLNSRNSSEALALMSYSFETLCEGGRHAQFLQLGERILNEIDWNKEEIAIIKERAAFLSEYIDILSLQEHKRDKVENLIYKYEQCCEKNTLSYSGFLILKAGVLWRLGKLEGAYDTISEYGELKNKNSEVWFKYKFANIKGMTLRDMGRLEEALEVFESDYESCEKHGNIARCYMLQKDYPKAIERMRLCLEQLNELDTLESYINRGYAYYWIAEMYEEQKELDKAKIFITMCLETWKEYAPILMNKADGLFKKLESIEVDMYPGRAEEVLKEFMEHTRD